MKQIISCVVTDCKRTSDKTLGAMIPMASGGAQMIFVCATCFNTLINSKKQQGESQLKVNIIKAAIGYVPNAGITEWNEAPNHGACWSDREDKKITEQFAAFANFNSRLFGRTTRAIRLRIGRLGLLFSEE